MATGSCLEAGSTQPCWSISSKVKQGPKYCPGALLLVCVGCWGVWGLQHLLLAALIPAGAEEGPRPFCPGTFQLSSLTQQELLPDVNPSAKKVNAWPGAMWGWAGGAGMQTRAAAFASAPWLIHGLPAPHPGHGLGLSISSMSSREGGNFLHPSSSPKEIRETSHLPA